MIHPLRTPSQVMEVSTDYGVSASRACAQQLPRSSTTLSTISMTNSSAESNFRSNLSQFRWARGVTDDSQSSGSQSQAGNSRNPFSRFYNAVGGAYVPLRSNEHSNEEEAYFALSRWERFGTRVLVSSKITY